MTRREMIVKSTLACTTLALPYTLSAISKFQNMTDYKSFDVIIIGGSYAGLSSAMALGRALRKVLIIDSGLPCNRQTPQSHNFITQDGEKPSNIAQKAKDQVLQYDTVSFINDLAIDGRKTKDGFEISTKTNGKFSAKKIIFATGVKDIMPEIKGFSECWGISILHCPYCHGYEVKGEKTGILASGDSAFHLARLIQHWTSDLTIYTNGKAIFTLEQQHKIDQHQIPVIEKEIAYFKHNKGYLQKIIFKDGSEAELKALYTHPKFEQHCHLPDLLGCELTEQGHIKVDAMQKTTIESISACGDCANVMRSVANAVATGNMAGAWLNNAMIEAAF